jgi:hypothetical protein
MQTVCFGNFLTLQDSPSTLLNDDGSAAAFATYRIAVAGSEQDELDMTPNYSSD